MTQCGCDCQTIAGMLERLRNHLDSKFLAIEERLDNLEFEGTATLDPSGLDSLFANGLLPLHRKVNLLNRRVTTLNQRATNILEKANSIEAKAEDIDSKADDIKNDLNTFSMGGTIRIPKLDCLEALLQEQAELLTELKVETQEKLDFLTPTKPMTEELLKRIAMIAALIQGLQFVGEAEIPDIVTPALAPLMELMTQLRYMLQTMTFEGVAEIPEIAIPSLAPVMELLTQMRYTLQTMTFEGVAEIPEIAIPSLAPVMELLTQLRYMLQTMTFEGVAEIPDVATAAQTATAIELLTQIRTGLDNLSMEGVAELTMPAVATAASAAVAIELMTQVRNKLDNLTLEGVAEIPAVATAAQAATAIELLTQLRETCCGQGGGQQKELEGLGCIEIPEVEAEFPIDSHIKYSSTYKYVCKDDIFHLEYDASGFCGIHEHLRTFYPILYSIFQAVCYPMEGKFPALSCSPVSKEQSSIDPLGLPTLPSTDVAQGNYYYKGRGGEALLQLFTAVSKQLEDVQKEVCQNSCTVLLPLPPETWNYESELVVTFGTQYPTQKGSLWHLHIPQPRLDLDWCRDFENLEIAKGSVCGRVEWQNSKIYTGAWFSTPEEAIRVLNLLKALSTATPSQDEPRITLNGSRNVKPRTIRAVRAVVAKLNPQTRETDAVFCYSPPAKGCPK